MVCETCIVSASIQFHLFLSLLLPVAFELLLYGIFLSIFGLSVYIFQRKMMPGKLYVMATLLFFLLTTCSAIMDLFTKRIALFTYISSLSILDVDQELLNQSGPTGVKLSDASTWIFFATSLVHGKDLVLMHRCYRLWNARKIVIVVPALGVVLTFAFGVYSQRVFPKILGQNQQEDGSFFVVYVFAGITEGLILTGLLASRLWWLNRRTERILGKGSGSTVRNLMVILYGMIVTRFGFFGLDLFSIESGLLLPVFLGMALAMNAATSPLLEAIVLEGGGAGAPAVEDSAQALPITIRYGAQILSVCALTQVTAIASTLILVRIGLGVDVQLTQFPEGTRRTNVYKESSPDLERLFMDDSNPASIHPFSLKYHDLPSGQDTFMPVEQGDIDIRPLSVQYQAPLLPEPGRIHGCLIRPILLHIKNRD
ncbi:hypothetical protein BDP27DRAFT_1421633 [Rhodocollybia butyracea]|uniref:Uncharacterized protein n=1 Tax=Rhodocollybia butyracea TaxID=206335 RepID=A0A9P5PSX5_9AGAR|nr:hypothetical protein BDP27DRAFT_1421633 [Rhodocollybia butyracea]